MAAKITGVELHARSIGSGVPRAAADSARGSRAANAAAQSSEVSITGAAAQLASLEQTLEALPAVGESRVSAVQSVLASGQYVIDSTRITSGLMRTEQALYELQGEGS